MKKSTTNKRHIFSAILSITITLLVVGSAGATLAWYQYNTNTYFNYNGTSIGSSMIFDIGLVSSVNLPDATKYGLKQDATNPNIYWASSTIDTDASKYYLSKNGYATNAVNATTSGKYTRNGDFSLKRAPENGDNYIDQFGRYLYASKSDYVHFDLVFRIKEITNSGVTTATSGNIYLTKADFDGEGELAKTMRMHVKNSDGNFIFNPSVTSDGYDTVGGVLDLNKDGIYDYKDSYIASNRKEYVYGETVDGTITYKDEVTTDGVDTASANESSFVAEHKNGIYAVDETKTTYAKAEYLGYDSVITDKMAITSIGSDTYGYLSLDLYLEGWDLALIDKEMEHFFALSLEFGIDEEE